MHFVNLVAYTKSILFAEERKDGMPINQIIKVFRNQAFWVEDVFSRIQLDMNVCFCFKNCFTCLK